MTKGQLLLKMTVPMTSILPLNPAIMFVHLVNIAPIVALQVDIVPTLDGIIVTVLAQGPGGLVVLRLLMTVLLQDTVDGLIEMTLEVGTVIIVIKMETVMIILGRQALNVVSMKDLILRGIFVFSYFKFAFIFVLRSFEDARRKRSLSPKLSEAERDRRTVFVQQLASKLRERDLMDFLSKVGKVREAKIVTDRITGRSRGFGYVEFCDEASVPLAILLSGEKLMGIPILISYTETEKNRLAEEAAEIAKRSRTSTQQYTKLQVSGLHPEMSQDKLVMLFEPFGPVEHIHLIRDSVSGQSKGIANVRYRNYVDAKNALEQLNGLELAGFTVEINFYSMLLLTYLLDENSFFDK